VPKTTNAGGVKLSDIQNAPMTIPVEFRGVTVEVTFRSGFWTGLQEREYFAGEGSFSEKNLAIITENVATWNLTDDAGAPIPITKENVEAMDAWLLDAIVNTMVKALNPNATNSQG
jgi:hypothetical protein